MSPGPRDHDTWRFHLGDHPNIDVIRRFYEAIAAGDLATLRGLWTQDITFDVKGLVGVPETLHTAVDQGVCRLRPLG